MYALAAKTASICDMTLYSQNWKSNALFATDDDVAFINALNPQLIVQWPNGQQQKGHLPHVWLCK